MSNFLSHLPRPSSRLAVPGLFYANNRTNGLPRPTYLLLCILGLIVSPNKFYFNIACFYRILTERDSLKKIDLIEYTLPPWGPLSLK